MKAIFTIFCRVCLLLLIPFMLGCQPEEAPKGNDSSNQNNNNDNSDNGNDNDGSGNSGTNAVVETYQYPVFQSYPDGVTDADNVIKPDSKYRVTVEGEEQFVLKTGTPKSKIRTVSSGSFAGADKAVDEPRLCAFGCVGTVKVEISLKDGTIGSYEVSPVSKEPAHSLTDGKIVLNMRPYDRYVIKINNDEQNLLFVFANPFQQQMGVDLSDPNVKVLKAGNVYKGAYVLNSGETLFIEGGAILFGHVMIENKTNCHVDGPGIVYCSPEFNYIGVDLYRSTDCSVKNGIVLNKSAWGTRFSESNRITVDNWKSISTCNPYDPNGVNNDSCDIFGSSNVTLTRGFSYSHDDAICIKSQKFQFKGVVENVTYDDYVTYAYDGGNGMDLGYELNQNVSNITYKNIYVIRSNGTRDEMRRGGLALHNAAAGAVTNVKYENIYIEDPREFGFHMAILKSNYEIGIENGQSIYWTKPGTVNDVTVKNLHILKTPPYGYYISGYDDSHKFNVTFDGLYICGKKISSLSEFDKIANTTIRYANVTIK